jgi:type VI secretion system FHA domain protein
MPLRLEITSYHQRRLKDSGVKEFGIDGGSIGRSLESDWVLQDGKRYVSSKHAMIDFRSGSYYIVDTSSNGVYVNNETKPVGKSTPQRLFDGDRLRIGEYEMVVHLKDTEDDRIIDEHHVDPVDKARFVDRPDPTGHELVGEHEMTSVGIEDLLLEGAEASALKKAALKAAAGLRLESESSAPRPAESVRLAVDNLPKQESTDTKPKPDGSPSVALYSFFRGAGLAPVDLEDPEAAVLLHRLGQLMREMVAGLTGALHDRAEQKGQLRIPSTIIQPKSNNPLKFSAGPDSALQALVSDQGPEYLEAVEATREAFNDIRIHHDAMIDAVRSATADFMERFDPDELERSFDEGLNRGAIISKANKLRYWKLYREFFEEMSPASAGGLPRLFAEEISRAYEEVEARRKGIKSRTDSDSDSDSGPLTSVPEAEAV